MNKKILNSNNNLVFSVNSVYIPSGQLTGAASIKVLVLLALTFFTFRSS